MKLTNTKRNFSKNRSSILWIFLLFIITTITACSGGSSSLTNTSEGDGTNNSNVLTGVFLDSPVGGLNYQTATMSGLTDENGTFMYHEGEAVTFLIGDVMLGSALGNNIMTPIDLVPGALDETHPTVTNICRLLQSLDQDGNLDNGIMITEVMHAEMTDRMIDITLGMAEFEDYDMEALFNSLNILGAFSDGSHRVLRTPVDAQDHFRQSLMENMGNIMHTGDPLTGLGRSETGMGGMP
jgi:para-nitrobenzyl esterase